MVGLLCRSLLFQIILVCLLQSRLPLNANPSVEAVSEYECGPLNEVPISCALELRSEPLASFAEAVLSVCVPFSFPFGFSGQSA